MANRKSLAASLTQVIILGSALLSTASACAADAERGPGFADAVLGRWDVTVTAKDGHRYPSWFDLRLRTEAELMASVVGRLGSARHASAVEYADGKLKLRVPRQYERGTADLMFEGTLKNGRLAGTTRDEDGAVIGWTAQRAPLLPRRTRQRWGGPVALFNGHDLQGWHAQGAQAVPCWHVRQGVLSNDGPCANLVSDASFGDFKLRMEFMNIVGGNSGVYLRGRYEVQLSDAAGQAPDALRMGAIYGHLRPQWNAVRKAGEWQTLEVTLSGRFVTVMLNGSTVIDAQEIPGITGGALDSHEADRGPLLLQGDHTRVSIRHLSVAPAIE